MSQTGNCATVTVIYRCRSLSILSKNHVKYLLMASKHIRKSSSSLLVREGLTKTHMDHLVQASAMLGTIKFIWAIENAQVAI